MGRTKTKSIEQPDDHTCGPTAIKIALRVLGKRKSLQLLISLCGTTARHGTSVRKMVTAINKLGFPVLAVQWSTLNHLQVALKHWHGHARAVIVDYLYDVKKDQTPHEDSGHYATVASYSARSSRIILFDPATGKKKSYKWSDFQNRWYDFDYKRIKVNNGQRKFKQVKNWNNRLMLIIAKQPKHLPKFKTPYAKLYLPKHLRPEPKPKTSRTPISSQPIVAQLTLN